MKTDEPLTNVLQDMNARLTAIEAAFIAIEAALESEGIRGGEPMPIEEPLSKDAIEP